MKHMKKVISLAVATVLLLSVFTLLIVTASASERKTVTMKYGSAEVELTLVEDFSTFEATPSLGMGTVSNDDGKIKMESSNIVDLYGIQSSMLAENNDLAGAVNFVFSVKNRSDGDIFFCFQPTNPSVGNLFLAPTSEEYPVLLVDTDGKAVTTKSNVSQDTVGNRFAYVVPMGFEGYIIIPAGLITAHNQWSTPFFSGDPVLTHVGFHVAVDDAIYLEVILDDMFICGELPTYEAPKPAETTVPETEPITEPATEPVTVPETQPETVPETEPETTVPVETEPEVSADSEPVEEDTTTDATTETEPVKEGCGAVVGGLVILPAVAIAVGFAVRKKED